MNLPLKFLPRVSQQAAELIGGLVLTGVGVVLLLSYLPGSPPAPHEGFLAWLGGNRVVLPFLALSACVIVAGLCWVAVAALNIGSGSPFEYLVVDRLGITYRNFWGERRYAWSELGPIDVWRVPIWQTRRGQNRYWIVADTVGESDGGGGMVRAFFLGRPRSSLRIPAAAYVASGFLAGSVSLAAADAAGWLETLRQMARADVLDKEELPAPPDCFRAPLALAGPAPGEIRPEPDAAHG